MTQDLGNSRIFVIASEAKQSLGILEFYLGILEFLVNSLRNSRILYYVILGLNPRVSIEILNLFMMRSPEGVGGWHKAREF